MTALCFADSETRSLLDVTQVGAYKYAHHASTEALVWSWAIDDEPPGVWSPEWSWGARPDRHPEQLLDHIQSGGYFIAWNAFFDRWIWNAVMVPKYGWPELPLEQVLCAQAQAEANNLPGKLEKACLALGTPYKKDPRGAYLIRTLSNGDRASWDRERFETVDHMGHFRAYCRRDVFAMRDVWQYTRPLMESEWREYHASERINDRGVLVDVPFARAAMRYARAEAADINAELIEITGDKEMRVTNHLRKARWLHEALIGNDAMQNIVRRPERVEGKPRYSCDRSTREAVLDAIVQPEREGDYHAKQIEKIIHFLELIEAGNSAAVRKFTAMVAQEIAGRVHGQYSFNGAGQTGRFSSRGIQIHNLIRAALDKENSDTAIDAIEAVVSGMDADNLVATFGLPLSRLLARLIRPAFIAKEKHHFVWADWDQIEAMTLPWLSFSSGGEAKLDLFRRGRPVYKYAAAPIFNKPPESITEAERQIGKVAELSLGFGGAVGAFTAMGRGYGVYVREEQALNIVQSWRKHNRWCVSFWDELWSAALSAFRTPGTWFNAGRVSYVYSDIMRGTLICVLPDKRWLVYPQFRYERVEHTHPDGRVEHRMQASFIRGFGSGSGRVKLWHGTLAENITQATAASFLRRALVAFEDVAVLHTHDEIVVEVPERQVSSYAARLESVMTELPDWAEGLPLSVTVESGPYYTK